MTKTTQNKSLYDALEMKGENSIFKSVVITKEIAEGYPVVEVEPYDDTFLNAIRYPSGYEKTVDKISKRVFEYFKGETVWVRFYTSYGHRERLLSEFSMKEVYKLF